MSERVNGCIVLLRSTVADPVAGNVILAFDEDGEQYVTAIHNEGAKQWCDGDYFATRFDNQSDGKIALSEAIANYNARAERLAARVMRV